MIAIRIAIKIAIKIAIHQLPIAVIRISHLLSTPRKVSQRRTGEFIELSSETYKNSSVHQANFKDWHALRELGVTHTVRMHLTLTGYLYPIRLILKYLFAISTCLAINHLCLRYLSHHLIKYLYGPTTTSTCYCIIISSRSSSSLSSSTTASYYFYLHRHRPSPSIDHRHRSTIDHRPSTIDHRPST